MPLPDVFLVPHNGNFVLHAPRHGVTSLVNGAVASELKACLGRGSAEGASDRVRPLAETLLTREPLGVPAKTGPFAPRAVSILPTNDCNMRCLYCAPGAGSGDTTVMSEQVCEAALRYQAEVVRREGYKSLIVYYFGGEPFLAWDLVQFCDARGRELAKRLGVPFWCSCTTNAFMSEQRARWVGEHLAFALVSLDGPGELHDRYRPTAGGGPTHATVVRNLAIFRECGLQYALRCSVDSVIVKRLPEIAEYLCGFSPVAINLEPLIEHGRSIECGLKSPDPDEFIAAVIAAGRVARENGVTLKLTTAQTERLAESNCEVAGDNFVVSPDGIVAACYGCNHRGSPNAADYALGEVSATSGTVVIDQTKVERVRGYGVSNIPRCRDCFAKWHCSGGCRLFHTAPFSTEPANAMCNVTQRLTLWRILEQLTLHDEAAAVAEKVV